jgi:hypothetical protein
MPHAPNDLDQWIMPPGNVIMVSELNDLDHC